MLYLVIFIVEFWPNNSKPSAMQIHSGISAISHIFWSLIFILLPLMPPIYLCILYRYFLYISYPTNPIKSVWIIFWWLVRDIWYAFVKNASHFTSGKNVDNLEYASHKYVMSLQFDHALFLRRVLSRSLFCSNTLD